MHRRSRSKKSGRRRQPKAPYCPRYLDRAARQEWRRLVPALMRRGILRAGDEILPGILCEAYSTMMAARKQLDKRGSVELVVKTSSGYEQKNPLLTIID